MDNSSFNWIQRMGRHQAYHQSKTNKIVHFLCIPFELLGAIAILSLIPLFSYSGLHLNFALLVILALTPIYLKTNFTMGICMVSILLGMWFGIEATPTGVYRFVGGVASFILPFLIQTKVGHGVFEVNGNDDTKININDFKKTKNPIPLLLIFYYHIVVEIFFFFGFKKRLKNAVDEHTEELLTQWKKVRD